MTKIRDWKMKRKKLFLCILGILGIVLTSCGTKEDTQEQEELFGDINVEKARKKIG